MLRDLSFFFNNKQHGLASYLFLAPLTFVLPLNIDLQFKSLTFFLFFAYLFYSQKRVLRFKLSPFLILGSLLFFLDPILSFFRDGILFFSDTRLGLLLIPLLFGFVHTNKQKYYNQTMIGLLLGNYIYTLSVLFSYFISENVIFDYFHFKDWYFHSGIYIHHTYSGLFIVISVIQIYYSAIKYRTPLISLLVICIIMVGSKFSVGFLLIILPFIVIRKKLRLLWVTIMALLSSCYYYFLNQFDDSLYWSSFTRIKIWKRVFSILNGEIILEGVEQVDDWAYVIGIGKYSIKERLMNYDAHNVFLQELLSNGLVGLIILLVLFGFLFKSLYKDKEALFVFLAFMAFGCIENLFELQIGVTSFVFFLGVFFWKNKFPEKQIA